MNLKRLFLYVSLLLILMVGSTGCSNDEETEIVPKEEMLDNPKGGENNSEGEEKTSNFLGTWELKKLNPHNTGWVDADANQLTVIFQENGTLRIDNNGNVFVGSGEYSYSCTYWKEPDYDYEIVIQRADKWEVYHGSLIIGANNELTISNRYSADNVYFHNPSSYLFYKKQ